MPRPRRLFPLLVLFAAGGCALAVAGDLDAERASLYESYGGKLNELAAECRAQHLDEAAAELTAWLPERSADHLTLFVLSSTWTDSGKMVPAWVAKWTVLRRAQAEALMALARQALAERQPSLAYQLFTETLREDPDHESARRMLGYVRHRDGWSTPFAARQAKAGKRWVDRFGWLPSAHVARYEADERILDGRWISAEAEAKLRRDIKRGWRIESDHYVITTNAGLEEGVRLSRQLETLYAIWQQTFIGYLASDGELAKRFEGRASRREPRQHNVIYYRTREEYQSALRRLQPKIDMTLGIYLNETRTAYFFAGEEQQPGTVYHEATHQLFHEAPRVAADVGRASNFWAIEGIACYMESLADQAGGAYYTLGGANAGRVPAARHRLLTDNFYVPLDELVGIGMQDLQADPRIQPLYSQAAGLADFFMHDAAGRYREPFVAYLTAIYRGRADQRTLAELTDVDYETLDRQYRAFLGQGTDAEP